MDSDGLSRRTVVRGLGVAIGGVAAGCSGGGQTTPTAAPPAGSLRTDGVDDDDRFGTALAADGSRVAVGAPIDEGPDGEVRAVGTTRLFGREDGAWTASATLTPVPGGTGAWFGDAVALAGDTLLVGTPYAGSSRTGDAHVVVESGGEWRQVNSLATEGRVSFGQAVALADGLGVVGAPQDDGQSGGIFQGSATVVEAVDGWSRVSDSVVYASDGESTDSFGAAVAIAGETVLVGAPGSEPGAVAVFERDGDGWAQRGTLSPDGDGTADAAFGSALATAGGRVFVGAPEDGPGSVTVFERDGDGWRRRATLTPPSGDPQDFGGAVAADGETVLVGAPEGETRDVGAPEGEIRDGVRTGVAHVFERGDGTWEHVGRYRPAAGSKGDDFGGAVALADGRGFVGAPEANTDHGPNAGTVAVLDL